MPLNSNPEARLRNAAIYLTELLLTTSSEYEIFEAYEDYKHWQRIVDNLDKFEQGIFEEAR